MLSVIIPVYNEERTLQELLSKVSKVDIFKEIIIVDDGSTDDSVKIAKRFGIKPIIHKKNKGKGAAIRTGLKHAKGDIVIIQDADLEYEPEDYPLILKPFDYGFNAVYGSRRLNPYNNPFSSLSFYIGGNVLTTITNLLYGLRLTDSSTGYKAIRREVLNDLNLDCERFEFCPMVNARLAKKGVRIFEVPIRYYPRSKKEGKHITWQDGIQALKTLIKEKLTKM